MGLKFTKMHGLGNDFMVIDGVNQTLNLSSDIITQLADRHTGIGFDQCLIVEESHKKNIDFLYRILNADGSEVGQCGNGARCLARFIHLKKLSTKKTVTVATSTSVMDLTINDDDSVSICLPAPEFSPDALPMLNTQQDFYQVAFQEQPIPFNALSVGNPHAVIRVENIEDSPVNELGHFLCHHPIFPQQANIGFMQLLNKHHMKLRVFERGAAETMACGSGAIAAAVSAIAFHGADAPMTVDLPGGKLTIHWQKPRGKITLTGAATFVYEGELCESSF